MDFEEIEKLAKEKLVNHDTFLFKGMEDEHTVGSNWMNWTLI